MRLEDVFREEARRALGVERVTLEQLVRTIGEFLASATPEEAAAFRQLVRGMAAGSGEPAAPSTSPGAATSAVSEAVAALDAFLAKKAAGSQAAAAAPDAPTPTASPVTAPRRATAAPFRVAYPVPASRPRAVPPVPSEALELEPDDIEDFTDPAFATAP